MARSPALLALLLSSVAVAAPPPALPDAAPVHLGVALKLRDPDGLKQLLTAQQDPTSPSYHAWLDPAGFADRFGPSPAEYAEVASWFEAHGFTVTRSPNRSFLEAVGHVREVRSSLAVQPRWGEAGGRRFHTFDGSVRLPAAFADRIIHISGLDTRVRHRHRLDVSYQGGTVQVLGPDDIRLQYDLQPLLAAGTPSTCSGSDGPLASCFTTVVLGGQEGTSPGDGQSCANLTPGPPFIPPSADAIGAYFSLAHASAHFNPIVLPNPGNDFDYCGSNIEAQLDVEMQSVGAANAANIDLVLSPASEIFDTGAQYVVNQLPKAVAVSLSIGLCESDEAQFYGGGPTTSGSQMQSFQQTVQQGLAEGQMWFAASGDTGADDCDDSTSGTGNGFHGFNATVDFPGSLPEMVTVGGTQFIGAGNWNASGVLTASQEEAVWNEQESLPAAAQGGAGGGGQSLYFAKPSYQAGVGPEATDGQRDVPDLALTAATNTPGIAIYECGSGQDQTCDGDTSGAGAIDVYGGTSIASPLAAGIFALLATEVGCRQGDIHATLYKLGTAQQNGGPGVFHDVTSGNNSYVDSPSLSIGGFPAAVGYDLATGWGTVDATALTSNWPACGPQPNNSSSCASGGAPGEKMTLWLPLGLVVGLGMMRAVRRRKR